MKQRIYWLLPDLASAGRTMAGLRGAGIESRHMHFAARDGLDLTGLHAANVLQTSDVIHAAQRGLVFGGATGICTGLLAALFFPIVGDAPQWEVAGILAVFGGLFGAWSSSMIGISIPSPRLVRFESAIAQGRILLMVDVPYRQAQAIASLLRAAHPEAHFEGVDRLSPVFP
ncbi:MAG TPA: DUF1269 domain-containing protein [Ramlibacter sp.]|jgi:hypothetical protein